MTCSLVVSVRLHDARWHGAGEWPPSPGRLFQALVAALGARGALSEEHVLALRWLESLSAPAIAAPPASPGQGYVTFVPNNDIDAVGGDPCRIAEIRTGKTIRPCFVEGEPLFCYIWHFGGGAGEDGYARQVGDIVSRLYQFGRGVDMAWATADILSAGEAEARLAAHAGRVWWPAVEAAAGGVALRCPKPGTLQSLIDRHGDQRHRIVGGVFRKPREPRFRLVRYECPPQRLLLELKPAEDGRQFEPWPLAGAAGLATAVRDAAARRLAETGVSDALIERYLIGRGADDADKGRRVRIIPLPSVGSAQTDPSIRRVLVERLPDCPIPQDAVELALSNLDIAAHDPATGQLLLPASPVLVPARSTRMLGYYGVGSGRASRTWQTITPAALPVHRLCGRASGSERLANEAQAAHAVRQALRHAGIAAAAETIRVQREPFFAKGMPAEAFAAGSRFPAGRLWHVAVTFADAVSGPLVLGDGRYCGLGVMARSPGERHRDVLILPITGTRPAAGHRSLVVAALRRALMSRAADDEGRVPTLFSGHESGPGPASSGQHRHLYLLAEDSDADGCLDRLIIVAPWRVDRTFSPGATDRALLERIVTGLHTVRAGAAGVLTLGEAGVPEAADPLFAPAAEWGSRTPYRPTRHPRRPAEIEDAAARDLCEECLRRGLPRPSVDIRRIELGARGSVRAEARLRFAVGVAGPILLGRDAHRGGGLFAGGR